MGQIARYEGYNPVGVKAMGKVKSGENVTSTPKMGTGGKKS